MGVISSLIVPYEGQAIQVRTSSYNVLNQMIDDLLIDYAALISDVEEGKIEANLLKLEIEKRVSSQKGIFDPEELKQLIFDTIYGYGILQPFIVDDSISDIDITRYDFIMIKRNGKTEKTKLKFEDELTFERFCKLIVIRHGGLINEVDNHCRVSDKSNHLRINVCIAPRNVYGPSLNIRKHKEFAYSYEELINMGMLTEKSLEIIKKINLMKKNLIICGKSAAGKTTLLRALIENGDELERVLICETDTEIYPQKKNTIVQYIKKRELGGKTLTLSDLIKEGLTMSLDTYCIGEIVGDEAWDFIRAGYTDHRILGTLHSSGTDDALDRLMMLIENDTSISHLKLTKMISRAVHYVIYMKEFKVVEISKLIGCDLDREAYHYITLYKFENEA